eukprot:8791510-Pyramimonas_sp.AAC.2
MRLPMAPRRCCHLCRGGASRSRCRIRGHAFRMPRLSSGFLAHMSNHARTWLVGMLMTGSWPSRSRSVVRHLPAQGRRKALAHRCRVRSVSAGEAPNIL